MDHAVLGLLVSVDRLKGQPSLLAVEAVIQQLDQGLVGERAGVHGLAVDPSLPAHKGLPIGGEVGRVGGNQLLVGVSGDHIAAAQGGRLVAVHEVHVDYTVLIGVDCYEGQPSFVVGPIGLTILLAQGAEITEGKLILIHGRVSNHRFPTHEGHARGGSGVSNFQHLVGISGDHVSATQILAVAVLKTYVYGVEFRLVNRLEGDPVYRLLIPSIIFHKQVLKLIKGKLAIIHGGSAKPHLPTREGHTLGSRGGGNAVQFLVGGSGGHIAAAQAGRPVAVHKAHTDSQVIGGLILIGPGAGNHNVRVTHNTIVGIVPAIEGIGAGYVVVLVISIDSVSLIIGAVNLVGLSLY